MSHSYVGGSTADKQEPTQRQTTKIGYRLHVFVENNINPNVQKSVRHAFRATANSEISGNGNTAVGNASWCYTQTKNDEAQEIPSDYKVKEEEISATTSVYEAQHGVENTLRKLIQMGKQKIFGQLMYPEVEDLQVHIFIYGLNIGDAVSHLFSSWGGEDYSDRPEKIDQLIYKNKIKDPRVSYCKVDYIGFFNQVSSTTITGNEAVTTADRNKPVLSDVYDAIDLCQYTYEQQTPIEYSVPNALIKGVKGIVAPEAMEMERQEKQSTLQQFKTRTELRGWRIATAGELAQLNMKGRLVDLSNGFYSRLFVKNDPVRGLMYAYCTCGTNMSSAKDWVSTNILQGLTGLSAQYTKSVQNAQRLDEAIGGKALLFFIGHSLGGGMASNNAIVTKNRYAITFNAAGLNALRLAVTGNATLGRRVTALFQPSSNIKQNVLEAQKRVYAFIYDGEILNRFLGPLAQGALGNRITITSSAQVSSSGKHALMNFVNDAELRQAIANQFQ